MSKERSQLVSLNKDGLYLVDVDKTTPSKIKLNLPFSLPAKTEPLCVLHCNGILCLTFKDNKALAVWNPATSQFKIIRFVEPGQTPYGLGFGYNESSDDYTIVTIIKGRTHIFKFKANSWKESKPVPSNVVGFKNQAGTVIDQHMYWIARRSDGENSILCFDFAKEEYQELMFPMSFTKSSFSSWLGVSKEELKGESQLRVIDHYPALSDDIYKWVPERRGTEIAMWTSDVIQTQKALGGIQRRNKKCLGIAFDKKCLGISFACLTRNDEILIALTDYEGHEKYGDKILVYERKDEKFREIPFDNPLRGIRCMSEYVKSSNFVWVVKSKIK